MYYILPLVSHLTFENNLTKLIYTGDDGDIWLETEGGLSDFRFNPRMQEVDQFRQELANSDPYVARHGPIVPV